jgi:hypothetical protein
LIHKVRFPPAPLARYARFNIKDLIFAFVVATAQLGFFMMLNNVEADHGDTVVMALVLSTKQ